MDTVLIESPWANLAIAPAYLALCNYDSLLRGEAPISSHGYYTQYLDDTDVTDRACGITCGRVLALLVNRIMFYTDLGMSPGMEVMHEYVRDRRPTSYNNRNLTSEFGKPIREYLDRIPPSLLRHPRINQLMRAVANELHGKSDVFRLPRVFAYYNLLHDIDWTHATICWEPPRI